MSDHKLDSDKRAFRADKSAIDRYWKKRIEQKRSRIAFAEKCRERGFATALNPAKLKSHD